MPALVMYAAFVLYPLRQTFRYSFYDWDGVGQARWVGLGNYRAVPTRSERVSSVTRAFELIVFFSALLAAAGLVFAASAGDLRSRWGGTLARTLLFLRRIIPLAGAALDTTGRPRRIRPRPQRGNGGGTP